MGECMIVRSHMKKILCRLDSAVLRISFFVFLIMALGISFPIIHASQPTEDQVKAAFIYNFAKFTEWPSGALRETDKTLVIGVLGDDGIYEALKEVVEGKDTHGKPISVKRVFRAEEARGCHIIYIGSSHEGDLSYILDVMRNYPVLTVGDMDRFAVRGGMINFTREGKYIRFEINKNAVERSGLNMSAQLLKLAKIVKD